MRFTAAVLSKMVLSAGFAGALVWSGRLALSDYWLRQGTLPAIRRAISLTPTQATPYLRLAYLQSQDHGAQVEALQHALDLCPADSSGWIEMGLLQEAAGDFATAEHCLLRAAREDNQYLPRWTLANYYYRHDNPERFWHWAARSAVLVSGDPRPLFRLCERIAPDSNLLDGLQLTSMELRTRYLAYLIDENRTALLRPVGRSVIRAGRVSDVPLLLKACDRLLDAGHTEGALEIWNELADGGRIPFHRAPGSSGSLATNGNFAIPPSLHGFDWRLPPVAGVDLSREENPSGLRIAFSGRQPEQCEPLVQWLPVPQHGRHLLEYRYRTVAIPPGAGLTWQIRDDDGLIVSSPALSRTLEATDGFTFTVSPRCRSLRLSLTYRRAPGTIRMAGFVILRSVALLRIPRNAL